MKLLIVESPTKAKTIQRFLDKSFIVKSSYGHIRDLPKTRFGVDIENNFQPRFVVLKKAKKTIKDLKETIKEAEEVILSTDPDREGESIAWHLTQVLGLGEKIPYQRIVFHEITKKAIEEALKNPRKIDMNLVSAQFARRVLDRIVGYKLSPLLWKKIAKKLSAGRVQSVALRLIVEREREIQNFVPQEYWTIQAYLKSQISNVKSEEFEAVLAKKDGKAIPKFEIKTKKEADKIINQLKKAQFLVKRIEKKETKKNPPPPFITSTLQQEAWQKLRFSAKKTMLLAQNLYEKGFITYHRTDSFNLSQLALSEARKFIEKTYGKEYWRYRVFKTKSKVAQEAHEAIRPTYIQNTPEVLKNKLEKDQFKLYDLIWRRFIATQMKEAIFDSLSVWIEAGNYEFLASGQNLKFEGFLRVWPIQFEEKILPELKEGQSLELIKLLPKQHFTQPPARYTEATLIKELEKNGIGRPSTYAPIISIIQERNYVKKDEKKRFYPTDLGIMVNDLLVNHFPEIVDIKFTAKMEEDLDKIAQGKINWEKVVEEFYTPFAQHLEKKYQEIKKEDFSQIETDKICPKCGGKVVIKIGRFGKFYSCSNFPKCDWKAPIEENYLKIQCPKCKKGKIVKRRTKKGKVFYGCSNYPECDFATWDEPIDEFCPKCGEILVKRKNKIVCSNKNCDFQK